MHIGASIGPYRVLRHLGSGGMGAVWLAEDTRLQRQVALKMVRPDTDDAAARARLMHEARAAAALNHPHIATVHDVLEADGQVVIVFEYVEGETLHARIRRGPIPPDEAVEMASQIAKALTAAHAHGIVHRDLKPANVIIGAAGHVKVLDFGVARLLVEGTTQTLGKVSSSTGPIGFVGTPAYAAPEQMVSRAVDQRADLYALGVVLYEMITGTRPFAGNDAVKLASSKLAQDAPRLSSSRNLVPPALEELVSALLARDPDDRPASAAEVLAKLRDISGAPHSTAMLAPLSSRGLFVTVTAVTLLVALAAIGLWQLRQFTEAPGPASPPVIAVLPLANHSGDPSKDYVASGIAESLISSLAALPSVTVLSRGSVADARARVKDEAALARDLGATYLVNGSVQESGGTLRVSLNLVRPNSTVAWGDSFDGAFDHIFDLHSRLATALTNALVVRVSASERERMRRQPTTNPQALSAYWQGRALMDRLDVAGNIDAAIGRYQEALHLDAEFALAHAALARAYWEKWVATREQDWTAKALDSAASALRIDADSPEARQAMAIILTGTGRHSEAEQELNRVLATQPNNEDARRQLALALMRQGKIDDALAEYRKAIALRPTAWITHSSYGLALLSAARYDEAIAAFTKVTELQPDNDFGYQQLGTAYQTIGKHDLARQNYRQAIAIRPSAQAYSNLGTLEYARGDYRAAADAYRAAIKLRPNSAATHRNLGDALNRLKQPEQARDAYLEAVRLAEAAFKINSKDARNAAAIAVYLAKAGRIDAARDRVTQALSLAKDDVEVLFRAAVVEALAGNSDQSIEHLRQAVARGYSRASIASADEFESIKQLRAFQAVVNPAP